MKVNAVFLMVGVLALGAPPVVAQSTTASAQSSTNASTEIEEITVTAQRRSENLQDVPIAVNAVTAAALAKTGVKDLTDLNLAVPSLYLTNSDGFLTSTLRGIGTNAIGAGFENSVALYIDGVYYASTAASLLSLNNVEQVEVLKGPQGTLFGRNATAGLIQITTREPSQTPQAEFNVGYANYETSSMTAYVAGGLAPSLAADIAVEYAHQNKGWGNDLSTGREVYQLNHDLALRSKWLFTPVDGTRLTVIGDYSSDDNTMNALHTIPGTINGFSPTLGVAPDTGYNIQADTPSFTHDDGAGASIRWDQDLGSIKFASISAYRKSKSFNNFDYDGSPSDLQVVNYIDGERQFSQEFQLLSKTGGPLTWVAGAYYFTSNSAYAPFNLIANDLGVHVTVPNQQAAKSYAGYGQGTFAIAPQTNFTFGARYTTEFREAYDGETGVYVIPLALQLPSTPAANIEAKFDKLTFRASLDHRFDDEVFGYASFNRGFKAGGFNTGSPGTPPYQPETLDAFELGLKTDLLDRRLRINAAGFYYDYKNIQTQQLNLGAITIINGASAHIYGLDLDVIGQATNELRFTGGLGFTHPDFKSFPDCPISVASGGVPSGIGSWAGHQLPLASKITANTAAEYTVALPNGELLLNGNIYFNDGFYTESDNVFRQPSYAEVGTFIKWVAPDGHFNVSAFGKNLNDRRVISFETTIPNGTHTGFYQSPRTYGVTFGYKY